MNRPLNPPSIAPAAARYALGMSVAAGSRLVMTSGIVGTRPDGSISDDIGEQAAEMWRSVAAILALDDMAAEDIVAYTTYAVVGHDLTSVMAARDEYLAGHLATSTLIPVPALARPHWLVEVTVTAARA
jgi:2-iminobutanoate/2-iminopropanoate deaminase